MRVLAAANPKHPSETLTLTFDFGRDLGSNTLVSAATVCLNALGVSDPSPSAVVSGSATISGTVVSQKVIGGLSGATYELQVTAVDSAGNVLLYSQLLPVISL